ncbi:carboxypeptidase regulatory-like domain-containing protein [Candidatus Woesearchaeota archaeon]|nr:carboxypeptidase regulatory-like domain-containing protein [Candidatus Woesearchaeota archaeon]
MDYTRKMQKRGMILIALGVFLLIYAVFSSAQNTGCCTNPFIQTCEDGITEDICGAEYFYEVGACDNLPENLVYLCAPAGGFCLGKGGLAGETEQYCEFRNPLALCINQSETAVYPGDITPAECVEGCCICEKGGDKVYDSTDVLKNRFGCDNFCDQIGYNVIFDDTITDDVDCISLAAAVELSNISGYVEDFQGPVEGASVLMQGRTTTTDADGFYEIEDLTSGTRIEITISKTDYLDHISDIDLVPGENEYNFTLQSADIGTLEGTVTSVVAGALANVRISISNKSDTTRQDGTYQIRDIPFGEYMLVAEHTDYQTFSKIVFINDSFITEDIEMTPKEFSALTGTVASIVEPYDAIGDAVVTLSGSFGTFTAISESREGIQKGFYRIANIPSNPGNSYTLRVSADGFEPLDPPITITFTSGQPTEQDVNLVPIVPGCGKTDCTPPLDFVVDHIPGREAVRISWRSPCNIVTGFDVIRKEGNAIKEIIPVSAFPAITYYSIEDENVEWETDYNYEIIAYYPESDCEESIVTSDTRRSITLGQAICKDRYDYTNNRWIGFCNSSYSRKICNDENRVESDQSGGYPSDCSTLEPEGDYFCSGPDKFGYTHCKNTVGCSAANIPPFGICQNPLICWGADVYGGENSINYCFLDGHPIYPQFDICRSCADVDNCFDYQSELACELDNSTCLKAEGSVCSWKDTTTSDYNQGFCYPENYEDINKCSLCNIVQYPTIGVECTQDICDLLGDCFSIENQDTGNLVTCAACQLDTQCEDFKSEEECVGILGAEGIHFEDDCMVVNSDDRCGLGLCTWTGTECVKDGNLDGSQDCVTETCLEDTEPPITTVTQDGSPHIVININNSIIDFNVDDNRPITTGLDSPFKVRYCITLDPDVCCSEEVTEEIAVTPTPLDVKQYLEDKNIINPNNNIYYLKYWSVDSNYNREQTKTKTITADTSEPIITIYPYPPVFVGLAETASLPITINVNERVDCTDSLTGPGFSESIISPAETIHSGTAKQVIYEDLYEGSYTYSVTCVDKVGNEKTETKEIALLKPFITLVDPTPVTDSPAIIFRIKTLRPATCNLLGLGDPEDFDPYTDPEIVLSGSERLYETSKQYDIGTDIPENSFIDFAKIECTDINGNFLESFIQFTTDTIGPITDFTAIDFNDRRFGKDSLPDFFSRSIDVELECIDRPYDVFSGEELGFRCKETKYCEADLYDTCNVSAGTKYNNPITVDSTKTICYQSWDNGIIENYAGDVECVDLIVDEPLVITLLEPKNERDIDKEEVVLNIPEFDVKIRTSKDTSGCRFRIFPLFDYDAAGPDFRFDLTDDPKEKIYSNYPTTYTSGNKNFNETPKPYAEMYIRCELSATGEILPALEDTPKHYTFIYDPTPPNITDAYATTISTEKPDDYENVEIPFRRDVYLRVDTEDKTICKYDSKDSIYSRMDYTFSEFLEQGVYTQKHIAIIDKKDIDDDLTAYEYYVACKNQAGDLSTTKTISFFTNFEQAQIITSAKVEPLLTVADGKKIINNSKVSQLGGVFLTVLTNTPTNPVVGCFYPNITFNRDPEGQKHTSNIISLAEGEYSYTVTCEFMDGETKNANINFVIDQTPPTVMNITVRDTCDPDSISPEFDVEDNLSGVNEYKYRLYEGASPITGWNLTDDSNPNLEELNLSEDEYYSIKLIAKDNAGNWMSEANAFTSEQFTVLDPNASQCVNDNTPPVVTINETIVGVNIEVTLSCYDRYGCRPMNYGWANTATNCNPLFDYLGPETLTVPTYLCYNASDTNGNTATGTKYIAINDTDSDGILNENDVCPNTPIIEVYEVDFDPSSPNYGCGPSEIDTDGDLLPDFWEEQYNAADCLLDSNSSDSDANNVSDGDEDCDSDGKTNYFEYMNGLDPTIPDLEDTDGDGVTDNIDTCQNTPFGEPVDELGCADVEKDTDGDGMDDKWEKQNGLDHQDPTDADKDNDNDGLTNIEEYNEGTDPNNEDSDGDDHSDKKEVEEGFDPLDATSFPPSAPIFTIFIIVFIIILLLGGAGYFVFMYREKIQEMIAGKAPPAAPPVRPAATMRPAAPKIPVRPIIPTGPTLEEIRKKKIEEIRKRRIEAKKKRRTKAFEIFGAEKPKEKPKVEEKKVPVKPKELPAIKPKEKKILKPLAKAIKIPEAKTEFDKLAKLTEEHITKGKPLEPLLKITKVPKGKEDEFKKLTELIKKKVELPKTKKKKELTMEQKAKIRNIFYQLGSLAHQKEPAFERLSKLKSKKKGKEFEELSRLLKKKKR